MTLYVTSVWTVNNFSTNMHLIDLMVSPNFLISSEKYVSESPEHAEFIGVLEQLRMSLYFCSH